MRQGPDQIALPLDWPQAADDDRFLVSAANAQAFEHFRTWSMWPVKATILTGPRRSGRTLLARAFCARVGGTLIDQADAHDEEALFHAWNAAQESKRPLVMIVDEVPPAWAIALPDLRTRIAVTPIARIGAPDDALFQGVIQLLFADRGLHIPDEALRFISQRVERSYYAAERIVEAIDRFAIADRARLTLPTIRRALAEGGLIDAGRAA
jgi:chromosomal replication initiation ATPase DnaA